MNRPGIFLVSVCIAVIAALGPGFPTYCEKHDQRLKKPLSMLPMIAGFSLSLRIL